MKKGYIYSAVLGGAFFAVPYLALGINLIPSLAISAAAYGPGTLIFKDRSKIDFAVKNFAYNEWKQNLPIEKCVMYRINGKYLILNGLCWINNPNKLLESIK